MVSVESSKWGEYKGHYSEGVGHSAAIGYKRLVGFDPGVAMVEIVRDLADMGY